jgi:hypothetical protein
MSEPGNEALIESTEPRRATPALLVAAYWLLVAVPLAWGVYHTVLQATQLFR